MLKDVCLGAMSIFTSLLAILATANFLPKDLEERTIYNLLSKPIPRFVYLLGKLAGIIVLLLLFTLLMSGVFCLVLWLREHAVLAETRAQLADAPTEELAAALKTIAEATFNINLVPGILMIFVKSAVLASLTLLVSTFATSSLFTIMIAAATISSAICSPPRAITGCRAEKSTGGRASAPALIALLSSRPSILQSRGRRVIAGAADTSEHFPASFALGWTVRRRLFRCCGLHLLGP